MKKLLFLAILLLNTSPLRASDSNVEFKQLDANNDGYISKDELLNMQKNSMKEQNTQIIQSLDKNNDSYISREEFTSFYNNFSSLPTDDKDFNSQYDNLDSNKDGKLDINEINNFRNNNLDTEHDELFSVLDTTGDNQVSQQEFELFYNNLNQILNSND